MVFCRPCAALGLTVLSSCLVGEAAQAQVIPDADTQTQVIQGGGQIQITGGASSGDGQNLFHSFSQFDVPGGSTATFVVGNGVDTVLGRVTGGQASLIDGQVLVTGSNTNLILMNPAGVLLGPESSVSVPGSFVVTTASGIQFDGQWWHGVGANHYGGLNGAPQNLAFTAVQPGAIVSSGEILAGGDVLLAGGVTAVTGTVRAAGAIAIASTTGGQQITLQSPGSLLSLEINALARTGQPNPLPFEPLDLPGLLTGRGDTSATGLLANGDGTVTLVARNVSFVPQAGTTVVTGTLQAAQGVTLRGERVIDGRSRRRMEECDPMVETCDPPPDGNGGGMDGGSMDMSGGMDSGGMEESSPTNGGMEPPDSGEPQSPNGGDGTGMGMGDDGMPPPEMEEPMGEMAMTPIEGDPNGEMAMMDEGPGDAMAPDQGMLTQPMPGEMPEEMVTANGMPDQEGEVEGPGTGEMGDRPMDPGVASPMEGAPIGPQMVGNIGAEEMGDREDREEMEGDGPQMETGMGQGENPMAGENVMMLPPELEGNEGVERADSGVVMQLSTGEEPETEVLRAIAGAEGDFDESLSAGDPGPLELEGAGPDALAADGFDQDGFGQEGLGFEGFEGVEGTEFAEGPGEFDSDLGNGQGFGAEPGDSQQPGPDRPGGFEGGGDGLDFADNVDGVEVDEVDEQGSGDRRSLRGDSWGDEGGEFEDESDSVDSGEIALQTSDLDSGTLNTLYQGDGQVGADASSALGAGEFDDGIDLVEQAWDRQFSDYGLDQTAVQTLSSTGIRDSLSAIAHQTGDRSALVYVMLQPTGLETVMIGPEGTPVFRRIRGVSRDEVLKVVFQFRETLTNPVLRQSTVYQRPAQKLYDWIVKPLLEDLNAQNISTLLFAPDAGLRSLPFAALHDGEQFLVERFSLGVTPSINLTNTSYVDLKSAPVLAMGASEFSGGLSPLPAVPVELESIAEFERSTQVLLNDQFTVEQLKAMRDRNPTPIVHLATHGEFQSGALDNSFIQFWGNERLTLDRLRELQFNSPQVELLILSACRTAVGDPNAELGFAGVSVHAGVKSTLASVWYVADAGTLALMNQFYEALGEAPTKSQSLRQAQLALLRGDVRLEAGTLRTRGPRAINLPAESLQYLDSTTDLSHPYYWAGFTIIGSPW